MGVAVVPRLNELLRARNLTVADLERQIEQRFGLTVDPKTLYRLASSMPVQRADLHVAGAVAAYLGVGLDDLFDVRATAVDSDDESATSDADPAVSRRLAQLFDQQARGFLSTAEQQELETLVAEYGRRLHERHLREYARQNGISLDEARQDATARLDQALDWWQQFQADPSRQAAVAARTQRRGGQAKR